MNRNVLFFVFRNKVSQYIYERTTTTDIHTLNTLKTKDNFNCRPNPKKKDKAMDEGSLGVSGWGGWASVSVMLTVGVIELKKRCSVGEGGTNKRFWEQGC